MKKVISVLFILIFALSLTTFAHAEILSYSGDLSVSEIERLRERSESLSEKYGYNVLIYIENYNDSYSTEGAAIDALYEFDTDRYPDGSIIFYVAEQSGDWHVYGSGKCFEMFNSAAMDEIEDTAVEQLSDGEFYEAFDDFLDVAEDVFEADAKGEEYVRPKKMTDLLIYLAIAAVIALIIAFSWVSILKSQLTSVRFQHGAGAYENAGSLNITDSRDIFLYKNVTFVPRPKSSSSSGGGRSGGGGGSRGGKF